MTIDQLKPNKILRGPIFPEPVQVIVTLPMGDPVKLVAKVHTEPFSRDSLRFSSGALSTLPTFKGASKRKLLFGCRRSSIRCAVFTRID